ncbi:MAG TPA: helix-turn-helix domain-containing protein, partial [Aliarcobacter thereius]
NVTLNSMEKIAKFLLENEEHLLNLKQVKIAKLLNITPETLSRQLAKLKKDGVIDNDKGHIRILDHKKLGFFKASF